MKTSLTLSLAAAALLALGLNLHSQAPVPLAPVAPPVPVAAPGTSKSTLQILQAMKAKNQELLEKQAQTLIQLETLEKEADQLKIFAKRS
jgi:hypothetical protein